MLVMKTVRLFFLACLALLIAVPTWADTAAKTEKNPLITVDEPVFTFQEVLEGKKVIHAFIIKNKGDAILKIDHVDTT